jgi:hypothetical protein
VDTLDHLANPSLDAGLVSEVSDILPTFANDDASFFGGNNGSQGELGLSVFLVCLRSGLAVRTQSVIHLKVVDGVDEIATIGRENVLSCRHRVCEGERWTRTVDCGVVE